MDLYDWAGVQEETLSPLISRKVIHTDTMTLSRLYLKGGAVVPRHSHPNEQITMLVTGRLRFIFDDHESIVEAGQMLRIPCHVPHRVETLAAENVAVDLFSPPREDWIRGDDAYLRG